ncbi:MAG: hypothetical protein A3A94_02470 [Candidatus Portnoybacteria bacterium RIFCSPLOWO2_01_FULL_43_11]|uniref:Type 4a pilus biogenesis protein PilO n=4 Tax=Candidatus Portnoyibacteriota TaxID=1817913 RepID=A0A1G2FB57_9BACT|nr:MAG: hypothetical protein A2815_02375 [Candidatus Portnoybacteria bacterium RIFCSPHIGHO2_01_FULL_40_12b]OGZ38873.1 MAG: hypothetical protein A3A94_02470 [Candidatus Portnoybacteria bacterium RIFCSPLOWO2_01_FULL_43_11]OGZ39460.1 MAG: hypothetical protein A3E90_01700 [Candidatus Portnoybacteria bacterium RIFCSPHIGHO2_12_FULL_40_11]OGZ40513.1 MAG: hypothetical protein A3I20_00490 [Candidatus Portnoybacteria bacterium RIFCSPLOWO2_02_FULL_40_15]
MRFLNLKRPPLFFLVGIIILAIIVYFLILPLVNKIKTASQKYLSNQEALLKLEKRGMIITSLRKSYQEKETDLAKIKEVFLAPEKTVGFISNLENIAVRTENKFEIQTAEPLVKKEREEFPSLNFRISLEGSFNNLLKFIAHLENSPYPPYRLISLEDLTIKKLKAGEVQSNFNIKIYTR